MKTLYLPSSDVYINCKWQSNCQIFQVQTTIPNHFTSFPLNKLLQALMENPDDCENTFFNTTNLYRFHVLSFKLISPQLYDPTESDFLINTMIIDFLNRNHSLATFYEQKFLMLRVSKVKSSMTSVKQNSTIPPKLELPQTIPS